MNVTTAALLFALAASAASQTAGPFPVREIGFLRVWVVDASGGGDFLDLPEAVGAADDGDVIVIRGNSTDYSPLVLEGKGLTIVGDTTTGDPVFLHGISVIRSIPSASAAHVRGVTFQGTDTFPPLPIEVLLLEENEGPVWLEECEVLTGTVDDGLSVVDCSGGTALLRVRVEVDHVFHLPADTWEGLRVVRSTVAAYDSEFREGVTLYFPQAPPPIKGATGALVQDGTYFAAGTLHEGGDGTVALLFCGFGCTFCQDAGPGGDGLVITGASDVNVLDCQFLGGPPGTPSAPCAPSVPGMGIVGPFNDLLENARSYEVDAQIGATQRTLTASGVPGDLVYRMTSSSTRETFLQPLFGSLLVDFPVSIEFEGVLDASGLLTKQVQAPSFPSLGPVQRCFLQGLFFDVNGNPFLGGGTMLVWIR